MLAHSYNAMMEAGAVALAAISVMEKQNREG
jgi:hypothetical protein